MIEFVYQVDMPQLEEDKYTNWFNRVIESEGSKTGDICYVFKTDDALLAMNKQFLDHDYYTDIITFDYVSGNVVSGDIFISWDRVKDNASQFAVSEEMELKRVMVHGILHLIGYKDSNDSEQALMRKKEEEKLKMFHVEQ